MQATSVSLSGESTKNRPASHFTEEETEAQRNGMSLSWSQTLCNTVGVSSHGLVTLQLAFCNNTFPNLKPFLNRLLPTQSQSYFKQQFKWYCDLLESIENLGVEHIFLLRTSSQINNYFIAYSDDCILFDLFFSKLFNSLRPKSLCSDLNKEIGAAGFETVKCKAWIGYSKSLSWDECRWWVREYWWVRLELCISQWGGQRGILGGMFTPCLDLPWIAGCWTSYPPPRNTTAPSASSSTEHISRPSSPTARAPRGCCTVPSEKFVVWYHGWRRRKVETEGTLQTHCPDSGPCSILFSRISVYWPWHPESAPPCHPDASCTS